MLPLIPINFVAAFPLGVRKICFQTSDDVVTRTPRIGFTVTTRVAQPYAVAQADRVVHIQTGVLGRKDA